MSAMVAVVGRDGRVTHSTPIPLRGRALEDIALEVATSLRDYRAYVVPVDDSFAIFPRGAIARIAITPLQPEETL